MSPQEKPKRNQLEDITDEELALILAENKRLAAENERMGKLSAEAHRNAAMWAASASELMRIIGTKRLNQIGFKPPDSGFIKKLLELSKK